MGLKFKTAYNKAGNKKKGDERMNFTCIFFGVIFIAAGILFALGKCHIHIAAWKNMPCEEKEKINIKALCRNIGVMISLCGVIFLIGSFFSFIFIFAMIVWLIAAGIDVYVINKSRRYILK